MAKARPLMGSGSNPRARRGASSVTPVKPRPAIQAPVVKGVLWCYRAVPWQRCFMHLSIFSFWLVVLTGLIYGAKWVDQPISRIEVAGELENINENSIRAELSSVLSKSFFTLELERIRQQLEARPWVHSATVERQWPDLLRVSLTEERAVAAWNGKGFINAEGQIFIPDTESDVTGLPYLFGKEEQSVTVLNTLYKWQGKLADVGLRIQTLTLEPRGAWQIGFSGGWTLNLGKQDVEARLQRFTVLFGKRLYRNADNILAVDARYTQGVSVKWKEPSEPE